MPTLTIRNVPVELHRRLKARAALEGMSLSDYAIRQLSLSLERPSLSELSQRVAAQARVLAGEGSEDAVRAERDPG